METTKKRIDTKFLTRVAIFGAIASVLYVIDLFTFKLPFFPAYLSFHFDEIPAFIAGFAFGPLEAFMVLLVKTAIKIFSGSNSLGVGELADLIYSCAFILPSAIIYRQKRTFKAAIIGILYGFAFQLIVSSLCSALFILDLYIFIMGYTSEDILNMCQAINPRVTDLKFTYALYIVIPFNMIKNLMVVAAVIALYKRLAPILKRIK